MESEEIQLNLKGSQEEKAMWIGVVFVNHRIRAKVLLDEPFERFIQRLTFILGIEKEYLLGLQSVNEMKLQKALKPKEEEKKGNKRGKSKQQEEEPEDQGEDGQIHIPKSVILNIKGLKAEQFYLVVYIRQKTEEEILIEQQQHQDDLGQEEPGEKSIRFSPRKQQMKIFQKLGVNINESYQKAKRQRGEQRALQCPFLNCHKEFSETGNLKTHLRTHTGERPFVCGFEGCSKQFITKGHLKTHELIHSGDKPFQCEHCHKSYSRSGRLKIHQRTHTGEKPFKCPMPNCDKEFTEKGNLKTHLRIHSGEKPFRCEHENCNKTFTTQGHLTDHMRRHSGERPFQCQFCSQAFMRSSTLKIHMRRHTGEKPYQCNICGKRFSESGNLKTHIKTHEGYKKRKSLNVVKRSSTLKLKYEALSKRKAPKAAQPTQVKEVVKQQASTLGKRKKMTQKIQMKNESHNNSHSNGKQAPHQESTKKRNQKQLVKQTKMKIESEEEDDEEEGMIEAQRIRLPLNLNARNQSDSPDRNNDPQNYQQQNVQQMSRLQNSSTNVGFGVPPMIGSPQGFTSFNNINTTAYFPTSLSGYQPVNNANSNNYQRGTPLPSKQPSFQNLFASLQQNQGMQQQTQQQQQQQGNNNSSPTTKGQSAFIFNNMSPVTNFNDNYGGGSFGGYSPDSTVRKNIQQQYPSLQQQPSIQTPIGTNIASRAGLEKWKNMGSFSSITSLGEMIMNQKTLPVNNSGFNYSFAYTNNNNSRPISKQNSANNLLALSFQNVSKLQAERPIQKFESLQQQQSQDNTLTNAGINQQMNSDTQTFRQLQKSHSLTNLFNQKAVIQRFQENEQQATFQIPQQTQQQQQQPNGEYVKTPEEESFSALAQKLKNHIDAQYNKM